MKEPLNLPHGSVRALLAVVLTGTCAFLWATGQPVPAELLVTASGVIGFYFASRQGEVAPEALPAIYIPGDNE
jgi:hypothetical protein